METSKTNFASINSIPAEGWQKLSQKKIYFGHQSVGFNIIDGMKDIMKGNPQIKLNIIETRKSKDFGESLFGHSGIGKNEDPTSKTDDFANIIEEQLGDKVQIAFFKFCYVDIMPDANVGRLFDDYRVKLAKLKEKYPSVVFIHWTSPLTSQQTGPKAWIKRLIGKPLRGYDDNIKRYQFNQKIQQEYKDKEPIFDLAMIESTLPDGTKASFIKDGKTYFSLAPAYTDDGGHLNEMGRKIVAEQLLIFLSKI